MATDRQPEDSLDRDATVSRIPQEYGGGAQSDIAGYEILRELHSGGQGVVYLAVQKSTHRKVAIKLLHRRHDASAEAQTRFEREVGLVAQFDHPNIVKVFDSGETQEGRLYCVMEYVRGRPLTEYIRTQGLSLDETLALFGTLCDAVAHAHQCGIVHRDLKPSNILVDHNGVVKVLDFGLAKPVGPAIDPILSVTGQFVGTLRYTSPEQIRAEATIDVRADVYALGMILYEILTGRFPYAEAEIVAEWIRHITETPPLPPIKAWDSRVGISPPSSTHELARSCPIDADLQTIVLKSLAKARDRRYASAADLGRDIDRYLRDEPIEARADSVMYVIGTRLRRLAGRHQVTTNTLLTLLSVAVAFYGGTPLVYRWTPLNNWYESTLVGLLPPGSTASSFENVVVVGLTDKTDVEAIALREGVEGVSVEELSSLRRLHGRLMERLATSGCKVVAWDIKFRRPAEYDDGFVEGVKALRTAGVDVVVAVPNWWLDAPHVPELSENIAPHVNFGSIFLRVGRKPYTIQVAAQRRPFDAQPSLALAAYAHFRRPGGTLRVEMNTQSHDVELIYSSPDAKMPQVSIPVAHSGKIPLTAASMGEADKGSFKYAFDEDFGLRPSDILGFFYIHIPSDEVLAASTIDYADVLFASEDQLREWFKDKVVMLGDLRNGVDRHELLDGRVVSGCYGHAAAVDMLIKRIFVRTPRVAGEIAVLLVGAILGCIGAVAPTWRFSTRVVFAVGGILLVIVASVLAYAQSFCLFSPFLPVLALVIAFITCTLASRVCRSHGTG